MVTHNRRTFLGVVGGAVLATTVGVRPAEAAPRRRPLPPGPNVGIFVDPQVGDDENTGLSASPQGAGNGPLRTIQAAVDKVLGVATVAERYSRRSAITISLRGGTYRLTEPVVVPPFNPLASLTIEPYQSESVVIDGSEEITGWTEVNVEGIAMWKAHVPDVASGDWYFRQLFVNDELRERPVWPAQGSFSLRGKGPAATTQAWHRQAYVNATDVRDFTALTDVEVAITERWLTYRSPLTSVVTTPDAQGRGLINLELAAQRLDVGVPAFRYENVREELTQPGQWYLDRVAGDLFYIPKAGETLANRVITAPRAIQLLKIVGDPWNEDFVRNVEVHGLTFQNTDWVHIGHHPELADIQTRQNVRATMDGSTQADHMVPGVISLEGVLDSSIVDCTVRNVGFYGIELDYGCRNIAIVGNTLQQLGGGGIKQSGGGLATDIVLPTGQHPAQGDPESVYTGWNTITDNTVAAAGIVFHSSCGILSRNSPHNDISHNLVHGVRYGGISCGWNWGVLMPFPNATFDQVPTISDHNVISYNHVYDIAAEITAGMQMNDTGGIYCLGYQPNTVIDNNLIHGVYASQGRGIYLDNGASEYVVTNNVISAAANGLISKGGHTVHNNIIADCRESAMDYGPPVAYPVPPLMRHDVRRNILVTASTPMLGQFANYQLSGPAGALEADSNLYFDLDGTAISFGSMDWRRAGIPSASFVPVGFEYSGSGQPAPAPFVTGQALGTLRNNFGGEVGMVITVGSQPIEVTSLGRWVVAGNSQTHRLRIYKVGTNEVVAEASLDTAGKPAGAFAYVSLTAAATLQPGTQYYVVSVEHNGGDQWYNSDTLLQHAPVADMEGGVFNLSSGPAGLSLAEWQALGQDLESVVADPLFLDPDQGDYNVAPGSPAFALGFEAIDLSTVGPR